MESEVRDAINAHLTLEFEAAHKYHAMSIWLELHDLPGFASWMKSQSDAELGHARRFIDHLLERDETPVIPATGQPRAEFDSPVQMMEIALESERKVTASINQLYELAFKHGDRAAQMMLQWFINEQMEEENVARTLIGRLRLAGDGGVGLLMIDQELAGGKVPGAMDEPGG